MKKSCPILLAAWTGHYGAWDNHGDWEKYIFCGSDCTWYDERNRPWVGRKRAVAIGSLIVRVMR